jgi:hypothetical protein
MLNSAQTFQDYPQQVIMNNPQAQRGIRDFQAFPGVPVAESQGLSQSLARPHVIHPFVEKGIEEAKAIPLRQGTDGASRLGQRVPQVKIRYILGHFHAPAPAHFFIPKIDRSGRQPLHHPTALIKAALFSSVSEPWNSQRKEREYRVICPKIYFKRS